MKTIEFYPTFEEAGEFLDPPVPAKDCRPQWWSDMPRRINNETKFRFVDGENNMTVRACLPVADAFDSGYMLTLHTDVHVERTDGSVSLSAWPSQVGIPLPINVRNPNHAWKTPWDTPHYGYDALALNFMPAWSIKTPPGWSCLFVHPLSRSDLPFYTIAGVIDTDRWGESGNYPFLLKAGWEGTLPKGTPMVQVIPFKRESWKSKVDRKGWNRSAHAAHRLMSTLQGFYRNNAWSRKTYR